MKDTTGAEQKFEADDVVAAQAMGSAVNSVELLDGSAAPAPVTVIYLKDQRSFMVPGKLGAVLGQINRPGRARSQDGSW